ncbi:MAG: hypothetical protein JWM25_1950 [Thermoleophilia bacterium]|nr:hypothetical protein [Thermoleophilia bacterium]
MRIAPQLRQALDASKPVVNDLLKANDKIESALKQAGKSRPNVDALVRVVTESSTLANSALRGAGELTSATNLLPDSTHRYAVHAARDLESAARMVQGLDTKSPGSLNLLVDTLRKAEVSTRMGGEAGKTALKNPQLHRLPEGGPIGDGGNVNRGPIDIDGRQLDELGNTPRGGGDGVFVGHDGQGYGWDGSPVGRGGDGGGWVGPDGESFNGI